LTDRTFVVTDGGNGFLWTDGDFIGHPQPVHCVNHVGAGDCFASIMTLSLAHGLSLEDSAFIAYSAGRIYVQHRQGRPPWPHEIRKDMNPNEGKIINRETLPDIRRSVPGTIVFTNGVFRLIHAGHAWMLEWAKEQGNILVVGVNDDESAARIRPEEFAMPLNERLEMISALGCVDYVIPFAEDDPCATIQALKPNLLVKGNEYAGSSVPGEDLVKEVRFAPKSPYDVHCTTLVSEIQES
jgi:D-beta-D-heptose 7-phosphate kinase/D-beta-D-heptose 1-phosphate adenosyltransferase